MRKEGGAAAIGQARLARALNLNIAGGVMALAWFSVCSPQQIFNIFFKNHLQASGLTLGLLVSAVSASSVFSLVAIVLAPHRRLRKPIWMAAHLVHRMLGFVLAAVALSVARTGDRERAVRVILVAMPLSWIFMNASASLWWSWVADLIPQTRRATFFGRRSSIMFAFSMSWVFLVTVLIDQAADRSLAYAAVFAVSGLFGVLDILLHLAIPDPACLCPSAQPEALDVRRFFSPLADRRFVRFSLAVGVSTLAINVLAPFIPPYITDPETVGAPFAWIGIMTVISQLAWVGSVRTWGTLMDRFGRKPVVALCSLFPLAWLAYLFVGPRSYVVLLPAIALVTGVLSPGFWEGINQLMLSLTPEEGRTTYIAWYIALIGIVGAAGSALGGALQANSVALARLPGEPFHAVIVVCELLIVVSFLVLRRIDEGRKVSTFDVFARLATPALFRTLAAMNVIGAADEAEQAARALRSVDGAEADVAVEDIIRRLKDPDLEVREEAARALGRIGSPEAFDALVAQLRDPDSSIRPEAARALGRLGDRRALPHLLAALQDPSVDLQEAAAEALGELGTSEGAAALLAMLHENRSARVKAQGAEAVSQLGVLEAVWEIAPLMHGTPNDVLRRQMAISLGNLLGHPGEFYRYITGEPDRQAARVARLLGEADRSVRRFVRSVSAEARTRILSFAQAAREAYEAEDYGGALAALRDLLFLLALFRHEAVQERPGSGGTERGVRRDQRLGVSLWLLGQGLKAELPEVRRLDALLGFYVLKHLCH